MQQVQILGFICTLDTYELSRNGTKFWQRCRSTVVRMYTTVVLRAYHSCTKVLYEYIQYYVPLQGPCTLLYLILYRRHVVSRGSQSVTDIHIPISHAPEKTARHSVLPKPTKNKAKISRLTLAAPWREGDRHRCIYAPFLENATWRTFWS